MAAPGAVPRYGPTVDATATIVRPEDLCVLELRFLNLRSDDGVNLLKVRPGEPSYIVVELPPQHIAEQMVLVGEPVPALPLAAHIAGPTRLVFSAEGGSIAYFLEHILHDISSMRLSVPANAKPPPPPPTPPPPPAGSGFEGLLAASASAQAQRIAALETGGAEPMIFPDDPRPPTPISEPSPEETVIELPLRLLLSPHVGSGFAHASTPYRPEGATRVELWNTRLGVRTGSAGAWRIDERGSGANTVRAVWAADFATPPETGFATLPSAEHRKQIVTQTADFAAAPPDQPPVPVEVRRLILTALGGTLDALVSFPMGDPEHPLPLESWRQITILGRDQYVRVVSRGWLSLGHQAALVEIAERQLLPAPGVDAQVAVLVKRQYLVVRQPLLDYDEGADVLQKWLRRAFPFRTIRITTTNTPDLSNEFVNEPFWPEVDGQPWRFSCIGTDIAGNILRFDVNLAYFPAGIEISDELYQYFMRNPDGTPRSNAPMYGQRLAVAPPTRPGNTTVDVDTLSFLVTGEDRYLVSGAPFTPYIPSLAASLPALRQSGGQVEVRTFVFPDYYIGYGFDDNAQEIFLKLADPTTPLMLDFTGQSDRSGGFIAPNLAVTAVSRICGPYAGPTEDKDHPSLELPATREVDPARFFSGTDAMLLGLFKLTDIIKIGDIAQAAPAFVTDVLDEIGSLFSLLVALDAAALRLADALVGRDVPAVQSALTRVQDALTAILTALQAGLDHLTPPVVQKLVESSDHLVQALEAERASADPAGIPQSVAQDALAALRSTLGFIGAAQDLLARLHAAQDAVEGARSLTTTLEWRPALQKAEPFFYPQADSRLLLRAEIRARQVGARKPGTDLLASLENIDLSLFGEHKVIRVGFKRLQFSMEAGKKPDVDCVFTGLEFLGELKFLEMFQRLLPLDGFSDPPSITVDADGITAGMSLAFPSLAVGIFSLENIAFSAALKIPFIGPPPQLRFAFCSRENPFRLTVSLLGGGGFFGLEIGTNGVEMLECSLEFGACVSINLGVASGGVSVMAGIYVRMRQDDVHLAGYVRIRGNVEVLGIVSISIEVRLELGYKEKSAYGRADIILEISIAFFSVSVRASCEKRFSQSNHDPTFAQVMAPDGDFKPWNEYCAAFA
ncbi:hypothetical protein OV079_02540 [Nannocystis pusilla]|uniref:Uncharacterized protein n=1 Tax=Nannocystis pusilla TaxID=889268 RepID=A0A9X3EJP5_9BACT|nr:hypothetical protein [Nannocystis pusilla]MCY1004464.1 hypothetical protein [Nannocystis pusilla]